ncbi:MAG: hypothetical protein HQK89_08685 [Nitrospirae bacterium]|nr:hypothetical protein [Nitrospirota bacterium]
MEEQLFFGEFLVKAGKISDDTLRRLLLVQSEINQDYAGIALETGSVNPFLLKKIIKYQRLRGVSLRDAIMELGLVDEETLRRLDDLHVKNRVKIGDLLIKRGIMDKNELDKLLMEYYSRISYTKYRRRADLAMFKKIVSEQES